MRLQYKLQQLTSATNRSAKLYIMVMINSKYIPVTTISW